MQGFKSQGAQYSVFHRSNGKQPSNSTNSLTISTLIELVEGQLATQEAKECGGRVADNVDWFDGGKAGEQKQNPNFKVVIQDIDEAINFVPVIAISNQNRPKTSLLVDSNVLESKQHVVGPNDIELIIKDK